ncbi:MAG: prepilin peptidase [Verrucomicrobiota bacterium]
MLETFEFIYEEFPWFLQSMVFIFGSIVGSFLNVCIYRIPEGRSVVFPGSTCACGKPIAFYNNIPILTWFILRGKAACCDAKFSLRYPAVELLTGILFLWCWFVHPPLVATVGMLFVAFLICATFIDLDHMIIPDRFSIGGMVIGVLISAFVPSLHGIEGAPILQNMESIIVSVTGALVGAGLVYWIMVLGTIVFQKDAMGEGDVKFVGFIGAFCGWQGAVFSMFGGAFIGTIVLVPILIVGKLLGWSQTIEVESEEKPGETEKVEIAFGSMVPFGPMLALGGLAYFLGLDVYVDAYFAQFVEDFFTK